MKPPGAIAAVSFAAFLFSGCASGPTATAPSPNRAPIIGGLNASPGGTGLQSATSITFTGQGVSDPDGGTLTYAWLSSDGMTIASSSQTASHRYERSGSFDMRLTVTDSQGLSSSAVATVGIGTVTGTWDITCNNHPVSFPGQFVALITQSGSTLSGTISGASRSQTFPAPSNVSGVNIVGDPRHVNFGVEGFQNVWDESDFYFHLTADDTLTSMNGDSQYCGSVVASRR
jgi:hypothetical protein